MKHIKFYKPRLLIRFLPLVLLPLAYQNCSKISATAIEQMPVVELQSTEPPIETSVPVENPPTNISIQKLKPALAVRATSCMLCHSSVKGNMVTDFAHTANEQTTFYNAGAAGKGEYFFPNWSHYGARSFLATGFYEGTIYVPPRTLSAATKSEIAISLTQGQEKIGNFDGNFKSEALALNKPEILLQSPYKNTMPTQINTIAEYVNAFLNYRTPGYLEVIKSWSFGKKSIGLIPNAKVREVQDVLIKGPSSEKIRAQLLGNMTYYKNTDTSAELSGFSQKGTYFGNDVGAIMVCDGDLFVDGVVYLKHLKLKTNQGCRIHSTATIFIESETGTALNRKGIEFIEMTATSNIQLASSRAVLMGMGLCDSNQDEGSLKDRMSRQGETPTAPNLNDSLADMKKIKDAGGNIIIRDISNCSWGNIPVRSVDFERILVAAPRVDSRFTGNFKGVVITEFSVWSLGYFHFEYDNVYDTVKILPKIPSSDYFEVKDCIENNVDKSKVVDTNFRSCN